MFEFIGHAVRSAAEAVTGERPPEIPRMAWIDAMERYGSDKPDVRFGDGAGRPHTHLFPETEARIFQAPCVKGICLSGGAESLSRNRVDELVETCQQWGAQGLAWMRVVEGDEGAGGSTPVSPSSCRRTSPPA